MRIQILSDLHLEFGDIQLPSVGRDLLILAGDTHLGSNGREFIEKQLELSPVIVIMGNHEYYRENMQEVLEYWKSLQFPGLYVLENSSVVLEKIRFLGCTLWTDFNAENVLDMKLAEEDMNDFSVIFNGDRTLTASDTVKIHKKSKKWLVDEFNKPFIGKTVVITHHLPSYRSIAPEFKNSPVNPAFASDLTKIIEEYHPDLWIHGHTHIKIDYYINNTRIICNPRGYLFEQNPEFSPDLVITL